jgi:hypothetical protein
MPPSGASASIKADSVISEPLSTLVVSAVTGSAKTVSAIKATIDLVFM